MFRKTLGACLFGLGAIADAGTGLAQDSDPGPDNAAIVARLEESARQDPALAEYLRALDRNATRAKDQAIRSALQSLFQIDPRGTVSAADISRHDAKQDAQRRGRLIGSYLAWDLDADGTISAGEREALEGSAGTELAMLFATGDQDANGMIDADEMRAYAARQSAQGARPSALRFLMLYDLDQNGEVTPAEVIATIDALSETELRITGQPSSRQSVFSPSGREQVQLPCDAPAPAENADIAVLTGYQGAALATASIAGLDGVTQVGRIEIESGDKPLYVFLAAYSNMIWEVSGDTGRIAALVVQRSRAGTEAGAGVVGVAEDRVHFVDLDTCMDPVYGMTDTKAVLAYRRVAESLGRDPDVMVATYTIDTVALPSGEGSKSGARGEGRDIVIYDGRRYELTPEGPRLLEENDTQRPGAQPPGVDRTWREFVRFYPAGLQAVDPAAVVAPGAVLDYDVLPQQAGLLQLLLEGKLRYNKGSFAIERPIARFPAGLNGAHSVEFVLAEGVPLPGGSAGHSDVYSAETGECLQGARCPR